MSLLEYVSPEQVELISLIRAMGMRAIAIDGGDTKRDLCIKMGAEEFVDFTKEKDVPAKIKEIADGIGAHGVLVTAYQAYNGQSSSGSHH